MCAPDCLPEDHRHYEPHPLAGRRVRIRPLTELKERAGFCPALREGDIVTVEDWNDRVWDGAWWGVMNGNPTALGYAMRLIFAGKANTLPPVAEYNAVVYAKINGLGVLLHQRELGDEEVAA